ncbi:MAG: hypothetical protein ACLRWM_08630 [Streptococcus sp.]
MMNYFIAFIIISCCCIYLGLVQETKQEDKSTVAKKKSPGRISEKRKEINELFLVAKAEMRKISRK